MDILTSFSLPDIHSTSWLWVPLIVFSIVGIIIGVLGFLHNIIATGWKPPAIAFAILIIASVLGIIGGPVSLSNEKDSNNAAINDTLVEIEEAYDVEFFSSSLTETLYVLGYPGQQSDTVSVEDVSYIYEGKPYITDLVLMFSSQGGKTVTFFQSGTTKATELASFDPAKGKLGSAPITTSNDEEK